MKNQFLLISKYFKKMYEKLCQPILEEFDINQLEMDVLAFIANNPQHNRAIDIVEERLITKSNVSKAVDGLIKKGYMYQEVDQDDKRISKLYVKQDAMVIVDKIRATQTHFKKLLINGFDDQELKIFEKSLTKILDNILKELGRE